MAKKKKCVIPVKNRDDLCCARAIVTMKEQADNGSQYKNLRQGFHIQERLAKLLHRGAGVVEAVTQSSKSFKSSWRHRDTNWLCYKRQDALFCLRPEVQ